MKGFSQASEKKKKIMISTDRPPHKIIALQQICCRFSIVLLAQLPWIERTLIHIIIDRLLYAFERQKSAVYCARSRSFRLQNIHPWYPLSNSLIGLRIQAREKSNDLFDWKIVLLADLTLRSCARFGHLHDLAVSRTFFCSISHTWD